ncbi:MAG: ATP-binding cassette domain-containing protein [Ruminococcaceae bacterium]|nr:ATP-binding cassette domain-containing protein [Oscillospiraceae bacterium]
MSVIEIRDISKSYNGKDEVITNLNLSITQGEFVMLVGASGCGKTTLLKMINKLIEPSSGSIAVAGKKINDWNTILLRRSIGYVIQQIGLFPHMTIENNINYVLTIQKTDSTTKQRRAKELIELVGLSEDYLGRYPRELSGGQNQRVGVARALAADPEIILMDEPFGSVDEISRRKLQDELKDIHKRLGKTIIFVTHDIQEALRLGTRVILMKDGKIEQDGSPQDLIFKPRTEYVKNFFGVKGFQATLDETAVAEAYEQILSGKIEIGELYERLNL